MPAPDAAAALLPLPFRPQRGYNSDWLGNTFSQAVFLGNGLMAILAGVMPRPHLASWLLCLAAWTACRAAMAHTTGSWQGGMRAKEQST